MLPSAMIADRQRVKQTLARLEKQSKKGTLPQGRFAKRLQALHATISSSVQHCQARIAARPAISSTGELPIAAVRGKIIETIASRQVVIVEGQTGSGKTTQIPQYCLAAGLGTKGMIGCTQPRRIAAITVAQRISQEIGQTCGQAVGYKIRFSQCMGENTYIKIMTDGTLLAELQQDRWLNQYDTLIVDEAHERSLNIDFVLGILRRLLTRRKDLKLIITSATIDTEKFSQAFDKAPVIQIPGRLFPVKTVYRPAETFNANGEITHVEMAVEAMEELQRKTPWGDVLIFMPTEQDIRDTCTLLSGRKWKGTTILPLFARLAPDDQKKVFLPAAGRKIIVATNVAETSITIPGIKYVIDTGLARFSQYSPRTRTATLPVQPVSRSSADQRQGRCGRTAEGVCIRLYSEHDYQQRPRFTKPEILRTNLAEVILRMLSLGLGRIDRFPFIDQPNPSSIQDGFRLLEELEAIESSPATATGFRLTGRGLLMAKLPLDPRLSRILLEADQRGCLHEIKIIAAALSIQDPRMRPAGKQAAADRAHAAFADHDSDFVTLLNIWETYQQVVANRTSWRQVKLFCRDNFLSFRRMREWRDIHNQISSILKEHGLKGSRPLAEKGTPRFDARYIAIHKSILAGFLSNIATRTEKHFYQAGGGRQAMIFPGSGVFSSAGQWIVSAEMVATTRLFARQVANIDPAWIEPLARNLCHYTYLDPHWQRNNACVMATEQVSLFGLIIDRRKVKFGPHDPTTANRIFIRSCLLEGDLRTPLPFMLHNRNLIRQVQQVEDKLRRRDILVDDTWLEEFYHRKLPHVCDLQTLKALIREKGGDDFLRLEADQLWQYRPQERILKRFPDAIDTEAGRLQCSYCFDPGSDKDGVTVHIPASRANAVSTHRLQWLVPGMLRDKIVALLKSLPKAYRRQLVPLSETAAIITDQLQAKDQPLATALSRFIADRFGVKIPATAFDSSNLDKHLKMRIAILDDKGNVVQASRDPAILRRREAVQKGRAEAFEQACRRFTHGPYRDWDFGDLPRQIELQGPANRRWKAFVALRQSPRGVFVTAFDEINKARAAHLLGIKALLSHRLAPDLKQLRKNIYFGAEVAAASAWMGGIKSLEKQVYNRMTDDNLMIDLRTRDEFENHIGKLKDPPLPARVFDKLKLVTGVVEKYHHCRLQAASIPARGLLQSLQAEVLAHLEQLVPSNFIMLYDDKRLARLPAYLEAIAIRVQRAMVNPEKDSAKKKQLEQFQDHFRRLTRSLTPESSLEKRQHLEKLFWLLEEFRISVFAQEIRTTVPVSAKRLQGMIEELDQMV